MWDFIRVHVSELPPRTLRLTFEIPDLVKKSIHPFPYKYNKTTNPKVIEEPKTKPMIQAETSFLYIY